MRPFGAFIGAALMFATAHAAHGASQPYPEVLHDF